MRMIQAGWGNNENVAKGSCEAARTESYSANPKKYREGFHDR
jgi:hypothetical protein